jgi:hypothetical protein
MSEILTEIGIEAPAELVWAILTDFRTYARWNPFIRAVSGRATTGRTVEVTLQRGADEVTSTQVLMSVTAPRELRWRSRFRLPGLFENEHKFRIDAKRGGGVRFRQIQSFRGLLALMFSRKRNLAVEHDCAQMNLALKERAEKAYTTAVEAQSVEERSR